jgi:hypothetical protein
MKLTGPYSLCGPLSPQVVQATGALCVDHAIPV